MEFTRDIAGAGKGIFSYAAPSHFMFGAHGLKMDEVVSHLASGAGDTASLAQVYNMYGDLNAVGSQGHAVAVRGRVVELASATGTRRAEATVRTTIHMPRTLMSNEVVFNETGPCCPIEGLDYDVSAVKARARSVFPNAAATTASNLANVIRRQKSGSDDLSAIAARLTALDMHIHQTAQMPDAIGHDGIIRNIPVIIDSAGVGLVIHRYVAYAIEAACRPGCGLPPAGAPLKHLPESMFPCALNIWWVGANGEKPTALSKQEILGMGVNAWHTHIRRALTWLSAYTGSSMMMTKAVHMVASAQRFLPPELGVGGVDPIMFLPTESQLRARTLFSLLQICRDALSDGRAEFIQDERRQIHVYGEAVGVAGANPVVPVVLVPNLADLPSVLRT